MTLPCNQLLPLPATPLISRIEEEVETSQPLVLNTVPVEDIRPNTENLEREETAAVEKYMSEGCGCDVVSGGCSKRFTAQYLSHTGETVEN